MVVTINRIKKWKLKLGEGESFRKSFGLHRKDKFYGSNLIWLRRAVFGALIGTLFYIGFDYVKNHTNMFYDKKPKSQKIMPKEKEGSIKPKKPVSPNSEIELKIPDSTVSNEKNSQPAEDFTSYNWHWEQNPEKWKTIYLDVHENDRVSVNLMEEGNDEYIIGVRSGGKWTYGNPGEKIKIEGDSLQAALFRREGTENLRVLASTRGEVKKDKGFKRTADADINYKGPQLYENDLFKKYVKTRGFNVQDIYKNDSKDKLADEFNRDTLGEVLSLYEDGFAPYQIAKKATSATIQKTQDVYESIRLLKGMGHDIKISNKRWQLKRYLKSHEAEQELYGFHNITPGK